MIFTKTNSGGTDHVWFYDMEADGFSLDDKRDPIAQSDIPDIIEKWAKRDAQKDTERNGKAFFVPKTEIVENKYDLSINRYKHLKHTEEEVSPPFEIIDQLEAIEKEIQADLKSLRGMI
jgi:type I restriction enzyme M protein